MLQHQTCPRNAFNLVVILGLLSLTGCGSTSGLQNAQGQALASTRKFSKVTVQNFKLSLEESEQNANTAPTYFADRIVSEIKAKGRFASVGRNLKPDANTLVIDGVITKYKEGNSMLRLFIGTGGQFIFRSRRLFSRFKRDHNREDQGGQEQLGTRWWRRSRSESNHVHEWCC